jgi:phosphoribosylformylglycinamidine synthase
MCNWHADPAAAHRSRRDRAAADRPRPRRRTASAARPGAGLRRARRPTAAGWTTRRCCALFFAACSSWGRRGRLLAYHDRSDGGLLTTLLEMAFAGRCGLDMSTSGGTTARLFQPRRPGAVVQVRRRARRGCARALASWAWRRVRAGVIGMAAGGRPIVTVACARAARRCSTPPRRRLQRALVRDQLADAAPARQPGLRRRGVRAHRGGRPGLRRGPELRSRGRRRRAVHRRGARPRVAVLREQGVNGQLEMAAAFDRAGFERRRRAHVRPHGSGRGATWRFPGSWPAAVFLRRRARRRRGLGQVDPVQPALREQFAAFFERADSLPSASATAARCCRQPARADPGSRHWPHFVRNRSEQFEARLSLVEVQASPSLLLAGMAGSRLPIAVAHGEGRAEFAATRPRAPRRRGRRPALRRERWCGGRALSGQPERLPGGITGVCTRGWPGHHHDAAPGARHPYAAVFLGAGRLGRRHALAAPVCQCAAPRGLMSAAARSGNWLSSGAQGL